MSFAVNHAIIFFPEFLSSFLMEIILFLCTVAAPSWSPFLVPHYLLLAYGRANIQSKVFLAFTAALLSLRYALAKRVDIRREGCSGHQLEYIEEKLSKISIHILLFIYFFFKLKGKFYFIYFLI